MKNGEHQLLPFASQEEQGMLTAYLHEPRRVGIICEDMSIFAGHFHLPQHATLFDALAFLNGERMLNGNQSDILTVSSYLRDSRQLLEVGGMPFITEMASGPGLASMAKVYAAALQEKYALRKIIELCGDFGQRAYAIGRDAPEFVQEFIARATSTGISRQRERHHAGKIARETFEEWRRADHETLFGVSIGIPAIDDEIGGVMPGDLIMVMGATSSGKSAFLQKVELSFIRRKLRVLDASFEMTAKQRIKRLLQMIAQTNLRATMTKQREFSDNSERNLQRATEELETLAPFLDIFDDRAANILQLCAYARALHADRPLGLIGVDHDDIIRGVRLKGATREEELASIAENLKTLAGQLGCPVVLLSQKTGDKARGSSAKQNAASVVLDISTSDDGKRKTVSILKNREGAKGVDLEFEWQGSTTTFRD